MDKSLESQGKCDEELVMRENETFDEEHAAKGINSWLIAGPTGTRG